MPNSYLHNQACYNSNYTQPVFTYPQKPKKSANICSTLGFIFGLLALFGYLFIYVNTILSIKGYTSDGGAYSIFSLFVTICLTPFLIFGPLASLTLGIVSICLARNPLQINIKRVKVFGILSIVFIVLSVILLVLLFAAALFELNSIFPN